MHCTGTGSGAQGPGSGAQGPGSGAQGRGSGPGDLDLVDTKHAHCHLLIRLVLLEAERISEVGGY